MDEPRIRAAIAADVSVIGQIVEQAYRHYIPRIGKPPGPMLDDYAARISEGVVWVIEEGSAISGTIVLLPRPDYLLLDNIAVAPARQGAGLGRRLLAFAEAEAVRRGYREIRLYTHQTMTENQRLCAAIGYEETGRGTEAGYERVLMRKRLAGWSNVGGDGHETKPDGLRCYCSFLRLAAVSDKDRRSGTLRIYGPADIAGALDSSLDTPWSDNQLPFDALFDGGGVRRTRRH